MLHKFHGNKCVCCGVNLRVSGYSEQCPAREDKADWRSDPYNQDPAHFYPNYRAQAPEANRARCYRCNEVVLPKIVRETNTAGAVGIPIAGHMLYRSLEQTRHHLECPSCGAPFEDDDMIRNLNGQLSKEDSKNVWTAIGIFALAAVIIIVFLAI